MFVYYLMLFLAPFMEYPYLPKIGTFTLIKAVGILAMVGAALKAAGSREPLMILRWAEAKLFLILLSMIAISAITLGFRGTASMVLQTYIAFFIFLFTTLVMVDSLEKVRKSCLVMLASMFIASLYVYNSYIRWGITRPGGIVGDANYYALIGISILPLAVMLQTTTRGLMRLFLLGTAISLAASILLGGSRAGLLGVCIAAAYLVMYMRRRVLVGLTGIFVLGVLLIVLPRSPLQRFLNPTKEATSSSAIRTKILQAGLEMVADYPLTGVGIGQFKPMSLRYVPPVYSPGGRLLTGDGHIAHNTYLNLAAELGIFGVTVFVGLLFFAWRRARKMAKWAAEQSPPMTLVVQIARGIEAGLVGYGFAAIFLTADFIKHFWILMFLGIAMNRILLLHYMNPMRTPVPVRAAPQPQRAFPRSAFGVAARTPGNKRARYIG